MSTPLTATQGHVQLQLLKLPLSHAIVRLAWPTIASLMVVNLFNLIDTYWVGLLGTQALGGMTAAAFLVWCVHSVGILVGTGVNALVARRVGEGRLGDAGVAGGHGLILAGGLAFLAMLAGLMLQGTLFRALHLEAAVQGLAVAYLTPMLLGMPAIIGWYAIEAIFRGSGDTFTPMWIISLSLGLNMVLDPLLIFGVGPFPALGIAGAAWATIFAHVLAIVGCAWKLRSGPLRPRLFSRGRSRLRLAIFGRLLRVGSPVAVSGFLFSMIYLFLTRLIADFGSPAVAAVGIGHRIEGVGYYICVGFAAAAATLVGLNLGAGEPARAERAAWRATVYATAVVGLISLLTYFLAAPIMAVFAQDPLVVAAGDHYLKIIALLEAGMALEVVLEGAFAGAGNSLPPMLVSVPLTVLRIPVA
ncbi:MAG: MATE family efflux transporter, partial [Deltaproteobacteria bacterium]|nr:MATE family efflux transporter [Deltaproteobacteria bacterium]